MNELILVWQTHKIDVLQEALNLFLYLLDIWLQAVFLCCSWDCYSWLSSVQCHKQNKKTTHLRRSINIRDVLWGPANRTLLLFPAMWTLPSDFAGKWPPRHLARIFSSPQSTSPLSLPWWSWASGLPVVLKFLPLPSSTLGKV